MQRYIFLIQTFLFSFLLSGECIQVLTILENDTENLYSLIDSVDSQDYNNYRFTLVADGLSEEVYKKVERIVEEFKNPKIELKKSKERKGPLKHIDLIARELGAYDLLLLLG